MMLEQRAMGDLTGRVTDVDDRSHEVQVMFPHNVVDTFRTSFSPDCFRESLARRLPAMCWQHRMEDPIGRVVHAQVTSRAVEMRAKFSDLDAVPLARQAWTQLRDNDLVDYSFGFRREQDRPHPHHKGVTEITRAVMEEISPVTRGAIPGARAVAVRSAWPVSSVTDPAEEIEEVFARHGIGRPGPSWRAENPAMAARIADNDALARIERHLGPDPVDDLDELDVVRVRDALGVVRVVKVDALTDALEYGGEA